MAKSLTASWGMITPWLPPRERPPDLERGENMPGTSPAPTDTGITPPPKKSEPMSDWLEKKLSGSPDAELDRWLGAHNPKRASGSEADTIYGKLNPDGSKREDSPEYRMSGGLPWP